jgi:hypothetical protein
MIREKSESETIFDVWCPLLTENIQRILENEVYEQKKDH